MRRGELYFKIPIGYCLRITDDDTDTHIVTIVAETPEECKFVAKGKYGLNLRNLRVDPEPRFSM